MGAVNRPEPALWVTLAAIPANAVLAYALIHGRFGLPSLDILGAGLATTIVNVAMCAAALWICRACRPFRKYHVLGRFWRWDRELMRQLIVIGLPISGAFALEWGLFSCAALLVGWIGTSALAAHQIALQVASILFMVPFGISLAATVRVGHAFGRRDGVAARRAGFAAIALGAAFMLATTLAVIALRDVIPLIFLGGDQAARADTARLAATLLLIGATFFVNDAVQGIAAGALRGLSDTRVPLLYAAVSFWAIGFVAAYALAFPLRMGTPGVWIGFSLAVATFAALLIGRFNNLTRERMWIAGTGISGAVPGSPHAEEDRSASTLVRVRARGTRCDPSRSMGAGQ